MNQLNYITSLDGLRFYCILGVMLAHWIHSSYTYTFALGVIVFFVLSGYLITRILLVTKDKHPKGAPLYLFKTFYIRRSLRIFPIYIVTIFVLYLVGLPDVKTNMFWLMSFTLNIKFFLDNQFYGAIGHLWSLSVEEQFYLFYPFLIFGIKKKYILPSLIFMIFLGLISRIFLFCSGIGVVSQATFTLSAFDALAIGGVLACLELNNKALLEKITTQYNFFWYIISGLFLLCYIFFAYGLQKLDVVFNAYNLIFSRLLISLLAFHFIANAVLGLNKNSKKYFESELVVYLGKISYGMYFYHLFVQGTLDHLLKANQYLTINNQYILFIIYFSATVLVSALSWHLFEAPINNLKVKFRY